jgi:hypothetical protein
MLPMAEAGAPGEGPTRSCIAFGSRHAMSSCCGSPTDETDADRAGRPERPMAPRGKRAGRSPGRWGTGRGCQGGVLLCPSRTHRPRTPGRSFGRRRIGLAGVHSRARFPTRFADEPVGKEQHLRVDPVPQVDGDHRSNRRHRVRSPRSRRRRPLRRGGLGAPPSSARGSPGRARGNRPTPGWGGSTRRPGPGGRSLAGTASSNLVRTTRRCACSSAGIASPDELRRPRRTGRV